VEKPFLNYIGVFIAVMSGSIFLAIRAIQPDEAQERQAILATPEVADVESVEEGRPTSVSVRAIGCLLAIVAGVLFGFVFVPSTYIQDHPDGAYESASKNGLHYVFAMYSGILIASMFYYLIYLVYKGSRVYLHVPSIFAAILSGMMWGIAQAGFLVANSVLNQTISFPLITIGPSTIAVLWSIFYFKDILGRRNYLIIGIGTCLRILAAVLIVLSKPISR
jgi:hypothetical protein